jgi:hypothetical protein
MGCIINDNKNEGGSKLAGTEAYLGIDKLDEISFVWEAK